MSSKVQNNLAILSYHEKRIQLELEVQHRFENLDEDAQAVVRDVICEFIRRSAMPVRIIYAQEFVEELENKLLEKNQAFQKLSEIHERTLTNHNDQLDYTWKDGYEVGARAASEAVKRQAIDNKIILTTDAFALTKSLNQSQQELAALVDAAGESEKVQQLRLQLSTRESELDQQALELSDAKQKLLDQAKRHQQHVEELKAEIDSKSTFITGELVQGQAIQYGLFVNNWRDSWKWISNWCFALIVFFATTPIPDEVLAILPEHVRFYVIAWIAFCGMVGRYLNQTKPKQLPFLEA